MAGRMFGTVTAVTMDQGLFVRVDSGDEPSVGAKVQVLSGALAARGCLATDDHNALVDARESVCAAINAQVKRTDTYERQQVMIDVLQRLDYLLRDAQDATAGEGA